MSGRGRRGRAFLAAVALTAAACDGPLVEGRLYGATPDGSASGADGGGRGGGTTPPWDGAVVADGGGLAGDAGPGPGVDGGPPGFCGDGVVGPGETCDPPASCPTCDDGVACTGDVQSGDPSTCDVVCEAVPIEACAAGDGCCPSGCDSTTDGDCSESCGNGVVEAGETCDPPSSCPSSCDDGVACTGDTRSGASSSCNVRCAHSSITACTGGDGCCPSGCAVGTDSDCTVVCGDGTCSTGETCGSCAGDCGACTCGDGSCTVSAGELCTSCGADCDTRASVCGNGECQSGESSASCNPDCGPSPWTSGWSSWEAEVVSLFNTHRAAGTDCPSGAKSPAGALTMEAALRTAARLHSWDQSFSGYFSHTSCNGRTFSQRASAQGTSAYGEIIARGQTSPASAVSSWMASTAGHCDIIMNGSYTRVGVGYAQASGGGRLWTGMFR